MTEDHGNKHIVPGAPHSISKRNSGLVRRGLEDLSKLEFTKPPHPDDFKWGHPDDFDRETSLFSGACLSRLLAHDLRGEEEFSIVLFSIDGLHDALLSLSEQERIQLLKEVGRVFSWGCYEYWGFRTAESEFAITMPDAGRGKALRARDYTKSLVGKAKWASHYTFFVEAGVATYPHDGTNGTALMHTARSMMER